MWYVGTLNDLNKTVAVETAKRNLDMSDLVKSTGPSPSPLAGGPISAPPATPGSAAAVATRKVMPDASEIGEMAVAVNLVSSGRINEPVQGEYLVVKLRITNLSKKPASYISWSGPESGVKLRVEKGGYYNQVPLPKKDPESIPPNETIEDTLVFEPPPSLKHLELDLPIRGSDRSFQFKIPFAQIVGAMTVPQPPPRKVQEPQATAKPAPAPTAPPYDAEKDPAVRRAVQRMFKTEWAEIYTKSLGKATLNKAQNYRKTQRKELLKRIADKHDLDEDQVQRILGQ
jgi:hypothetical protein